MEFPDFALVKLAARDLTGPGVEFYARRVTNTGLDSVGATLQADQLSAERLYMLTATFLAVANSSIPQRFRWYLQLGNADILLWGNTNVANVTDKEQSSPFLVIPGGKALLFVGDVNTPEPVVPWTLDVWVWGYSFPKGNVLSF